jgi:hypothetical protein
VFAGTFFLAFWTPRLLDKARTGLEELGAAKFYVKWLSSASKIEGVDKSQWTREGDTSTTEQTGTRPEKRKGVAGALMQFRFD